MSHMCQSCQGQSANLSTLICELKKVLGENGLTLVNILSVCLTAMQIVEKMTSLTGSDKKNLVIKGLQAILDEQKSDHSILDCVPGFIDQTIKVEKGDITIHISPEAVAKTGIACCLACLSTPQQNMQKSGKKKK